MRALTWLFRRILVVFFVIVLIYCGIQILNSKLNDNELSNEEKLLRISELIKNSGKLSKFNKNELLNIAACKFPELKVDNPEILKFLHHVPPLDCSPEDWVSVDGSKVFITPKAKENFGPITCAFSEIIRVDDYHYDTLDPKESDDYYVLKESDFVDVKCESLNGKQWSSILAAVKEDPEMRKTSWENVHEGGLKLNVLMFGFDSLSRNTFIRKLPKSYDYLKNNLNVQILEGYNIIGDGTPQALIPILTGKIELELPETRNRMGSAANYVDVYPFIWNKFKENGYITGFMEDVPDIGTFTYRLKGFKEQPTDHYMRTYYLAASQMFKYSNRYCLKGTPRHLLMMNYIKNLFDYYRDNPKFFFGFHGELSHDSYNDIELADDDLKNLIEYFHKSNHLNNTILILMSDHGHRFAEIRDTLAGKQEERLPFFSFVFPPWFKQQYPRAYANFVHNTHLLSTPFDIHKTLENIIKLETVEEADLTKRDISLFNRIPLERTCAHAFIETHWCTCLSWQDISVSNNTVISAANDFVKFINSYTNDHRDICEILTLDEIIWASRLIPTEGLLQFQKSGDRDGFLGDFSAKTQLTDEIYQIKVKTQPGGALFEASINHNVNTNIFTTKISDISRINKYRSQAKCVEQDFPHLRKYCYCKQ